jgi:hypothetical protein
MEEKPIENDTIENIIVLPRSQNFCEYTINNSESHSKHYEDMYRFLVQFVPPSYCPEIRKLLFSYKPFVIMINPPEIIELNSIIKDQTDISSNQILASQKKQVKEITNPKVTWEQQINNMTNTWDRKLKNTPLNGSSKKFPWQL